MLHHYITTLQICLTIWFHCSHVENPYTKLNLRSLLCAPIEMVRAGESNTSLLTDLISNSWTPSSRRSLCSPQQTYISTIHHHSPVILNQCFSNLRLPQNHLEDTWKLKLLAPTHQISDSVSLGWGLSNCISQVMLMLPVWTTLKERLP